MSRIVHHKKTFKNEIILLCFIRLLRTPQVQRNLKITRLPLLGYAFISLAVCVVTNFFLNHFELILWLNHLWDVQNFGIVNSNVQITKLIRFDLRFSIIRLAKCFEMFQKLFSIFKNSCFFTKPTLIQIIW